MSAEFGRYDQNLKGQSACSNCTEEDNKQGLSNLIGHTICKMTCKEKISMGAPVDKETNEKLKQSEEEGLPDELLYSEQIEANANNPKCTYIDI